MDKLIRTFNGLDEEVLSELMPMMGKTCWKVVRLEGQGLSLEFGEKVQYEGNNPKLKNIFHGEWNIGTWDGCAWRILDKDGSILCGSDDQNDTGYIDNKLATIQLGKIICIANPTKLDVRVGFDSGKNIDFMTTITMMGYGMDKNIMPTLTDDFECFHVFCPNSRYVELSTTGVWKISITNWESGAA